MSKSSIKIAPSILAGDFASLGEEAKKVEASGADYLHIDVMDGNFVPNISMGPAAVAAINRSTKMFLDVHIMVYHPYDYIERFVESGADMITFHFEATEDVQETIDFIHSCNIKAGLAFCPETSTSLMLPFLDKCDMILLMTVNPGFGGQAFIPEVLEKVCFLRQACNRLRICAGGSTAEDEAEAERLGPMDIQVDGGVNLKTAQQCVEAGANVLVAGTHLFLAENMGLAVEELKQAALSS